MWNGVAQLLVTVTVCRGVDAESGFVVGQAKRKTRPGYNVGISQRSYSGARINKVSEQSL